MRRAAGDVLAKVADKGDAVAIAAAARRLEHASVHVRYAALQALVQIADQEDRVACVRIALGQSEAPQLRRLMEAETVEKVFHFARFDVAALASGLGIAVQPLFCTKVGSRLGRTYTPRHGLKDLVQELVGVELDKGAQSSDWGRVDELTDAQLAYAANDVRYLLPARRRLETMLRREGRWDLAQRCFRCIPVVAELDRLRFTQTFEH